ncbi:MAG: hypothetical protein F6K22_29175 [Okeania sp. SIO2F4]|uniref:hypothetical protein n=1 Tax=Okeania sp. SIO2F4 TaxID=2607790 RepID=UPI00142B45F4|nr:hypothetical protein [Okeania sp. SIO2F4]NES06531.1 hypothetical protein [Okeania sp. SIO2F4]
MFQNVYCAHVHKLIPIISQQAVIQVWKTKLEEFKQLEQLGKIDLYYLDAVEFSMIP